MRPAWELPPLSDVLEFVRLIWAVDHGLQSASKRMEQELGVTGQQRLVVRLVGRFPGLSAGQLAEILQVHPSTVSGLIGRLEKRGLLERRADGRDRRRAILGLTPRGRALDGAVEGTIEHAVEVALDRLSAEKRSAAHEVLTAVAQALASAER